MNKKTGNLLIQLAALGALVGLAAGCASAAKPAGMVPKQFSIAHKHPYSTSVTVTGGKETNPLWKSEISSEAFAQAVVTSINQSGVFSSVINSGTSDYRLNITLVKVLEPEAGFNMSTTVVTEWRLTQVAGGTVVAEENIPTQFTATWGSALSGITRMRLANEGAARKNIDEGIQRLSELQLPAKGVGN